MCECGWTNQQKPLGCRTAEKLEWAITYLLLKDKDGFVTKEAIRGQYDGSVFFYLERQRQQSMMQKKKVY